MGKGSRTHTSNSNTTYPCNIQLSGADLCHVLFDNTSSIKWTCHEQKARLIQFVIWLQQLMANDKDDLWYKLYCPSEKWAWWILRTPHMVNRIWNRTFFVLLMVYILLSWNHMFCCFADALSSSETIVTYNSSYCTYNMEYNFLLFCSWSIYSCRGIICFVVSLMVNLPAKQLLLTIPQIVNRTWNNILLFRWWSIFQWKHCYLEFLTL